MTPSGPAKVPYLVLVLCLLLPACAATHAPGSSGEGQATAEPDPGNGDPLEPLNRAVYSFNETLDRYVMRPVASGYRTAIPPPIRHGVSNFFNNLYEPTVMVNNLLQGKFKAAAADLGRFVTNTTLGVFGLFDIAGWSGLPAHSEDFGQTLGSWGVQEGPYLVLPFFGPSNIRDGIGRYGDYLTYPPSYMEQQSAYWKLFALQTVDTRAQLLDAGDILEQAAGKDPYIFVREAYRQRRRSLINDGSAQEPAPVDPSIFEDDRPKPKTPSPEPR